MKSKTIVNREIKGVMKRKGSEFEYRQELESDLIRAFRESMLKAKYIRMDDIYANVVEMPCSRFWVSETRAKIVLAEMMRGDTLPNMGEMKREMYMEIYRRLKAFMAEHPSMSFNDCVFQVLKQQAPKFYLKPNSARVIICRIRRKWAKRKENVRLRDMITR